MSAHTPKADPKRKVEAARAGIPGKLPWNAPLLFDLNGETTKTNVHSFQTFEGGSYPTTHGPS
jgi:hypothetical protein